jgi:hypothetical protein
MHVEKTNALSDLDLLEIEMDLLWESKSGPELVLACARNRVRTRIGKQVPPEVARTLAGEFEEGLSRGSDSTHQRRTVQSVGRIRTRVLNFMRRRLANERNTVVSCRGRPASSCLAGHESTGPACTTTCAGGGRFAQRRARR